VRDNITFFGGDASKVMVFGSSGGGAKVTTSLAMPAFQGLYHTAAVLSGHDLWKRNSEESALRSSNALLAELGIRSGQLAKLNALPADVLAKAYREATIKWRPDPSWGPRGWVMYDLLAPVIDGATLPDYPLSAVAKGSADDVTLMLGTEAFTHWAPLAAKAEFGWLDVVGLKRHLKALLGEHTDEVVATYQRTRPGASPSALLALIVTDRDWRIPHVRLAEAKDRGSSSPFMYETLVECSPTSMAFDEVDDLSSPVTRALVSQINPALVNLARAGNPSHPRLPAWPRYSRDIRQTMMFDINSRVEQHPWREEQAIWDGIR
jgi:para-nitrobenzyl esterase